MTCLCIGKVPGIMYDVLCGLEISEDRDWAGRGCTVLITKRRRDAWQNRGPNVGKFGPVVGALWS